MRRNKCEENHRFARGLWRIALFLVCCTAAEALNAVAVGSMKKLDGDYNDRTV